MFIVLILKTLPHKTIKDFGTPGERQCFLNHNYMLTDLECYAMCYVTVAKSDAFPLYNRAFKDASI